MTEPQAEQLRRLAAVRRRSQAALLRDAIDDLLAGDDVARRAVRARAVVGRHGSGRADGADDHDAGFAAGIEP